MISAKEIINKGAEAVIFKHKNEIIKYRTKKNYRIDCIDDKLRKSRTKREEKVLQKLEALNILAPRIIKPYDELNSFIENNDIEIKNSIIMEHIDGSTLKNILSIENYKELSPKIGSLISNIHNNDIIHGDLTTSNMMLKDKNVYLIDFGLSNFSQKIEDKAVDLHLLKEAINSKHSEFSNDFFKEILKHYAKMINNREKILKRFEAVELRGRNKH